MKKRQVSTINDLLPQTQCGECGYPGCLPYAQAIHANQAPINRCPPGGVETLTALGQHLNIDITPYLQEVAQKTRSPQLAKIDEPSCIGCTKCIQACPVDAIMGAAKQMHVILSHECTGCGLCVEPCPVNCIEMVSIPQPYYQPTVARSRFEAKNTRLLREKQTKEMNYQQKRQLAAQTETQQSERQAKNNYILAALARAKNKEKTPT